MVLGKGYLQLITFEVGDYIIRKKNDKRKDISKSDGYWD